MCCCCYHPTQNATLKFTRTTVHTAHTIAHTPSGKISKPVSSTTGEKSVKRPQATNASLSIYGQKGLDQINLSKATTICVVLCVPLPMFGRKSALKLIHTGGGGGAIRAQHFRAAVPF